MPKEIREWNSMVTEPKGGMPTKHYKIVYSDDSVEEFNICTMEGIAEMDVKLLRSQKKLQLAETV